MPDSGNGIRERVRIASALTGFCDPNVPCDFGANPTQSDSALRCELWRYSCRDLRYRLGWGVAVGC